MTNPNLGTFYKMADLYSSKKKKKKKTKVLKDKERWKLFHVKGEKKTL